jgi:hypothetical protein
MGTRESCAPEDLDHDGVEDSIARLRAMELTLRKNDMSEGVNLLSVESQGGRHDAESWSARLPGMLIFLLADE